MAQIVKSPPSVQETQVQSLGQEDLLEKEMATRSSILAGKSHGQRSLVGYSPWGHKELDMTELLTLLSITDCFARSIVCMCLVAQLCPTLGNPMDCSPPGSSVHGIFQQEYWSGLPFPSPGDLPNPGINPASLTSPALAGGSLPLVPPKECAILIFACYLRIVWYIAQAQ